ncbi:putative ribosome biogenesis GTPase RsgA [Macrococcus hajekii]|uniref:ribosome small subunit-dependent GTPase A n=1 Tax=Macrococcus hajekii TaxID=198482 RepID=UPI001408826D|nr:ribosome small subunit-dependent GTPase A [Macrococcus hajekii]GGB00908.1 putative ribosome biogenesis GTPase RsgA [Macrococcus hajekii]
MITLKQLGYTGTVNGLIGRISTQSKGIYKAITEEGTYLVSLKGTFKYDLVARIDIPAVGDFVSIQPFPSEKRGIITELLPRHQAFIRQSAGTETKPQVISANVDFAFLAMSCNDNFNINRMERYLIAAWDSGVNPIILLTKADLVNDLDKEIMLAELSDIAADVPIYFMNMHTHDHIEQLRNLLQPNKSATILGSSGIGKSTLINKLMGQEVMATQEIRQSDSKGKHTTTHRELLILPTGGVIIDTPGMREFQLWSTGENLGLSTEFEDIESLIASCRFNDCSHTTEPDCAVNQAFDDGSLSHDRYQRYQKYQKELAFQERRGNEALERLEREKWKKNSAIGRQNRMKKGR